MSVRYHFIFPPSFLRNAHDRTIVPELRIFHMHDEAIGPHTKASFEVNLVSPAEFGAFVAWMAIHRGPLSALLHPNTEDMGDGGVRDHTQRANWLGTPCEMNIGFLQNQKAR